MDDFALAEDSPSAAGVASPAVPCQRASAQAVGPPGLRAQPGSADAGANSAYTRQWLDTVSQPAAEAQPALPPQSDHSTVCAPQPKQAAHAVPNEDTVASQEDFTGHSQRELVDPDVDGPEEAAVNRPTVPDEAPAAARRMREQRRISLTAPEEEVCEGEPPICPMLIGISRCLGETLRYPSSGTWQHNDSEDAADDCNSMQTFLVWQSRRGCLAGLSSQGTL